MRKKYVVLFCFGVILINMGICQSRPVLLASNIAPELSGRLDVDVDNLRKELTVALRGDDWTWLWRWLLTSIPGGIVIVMVLLMRENAA